MRDGESGTPSSADSPVGQSLKLLTEIQGAIKAGDLKTIRRTADALKSSITSVLAKEAFLAASALENTVREDDLANAQDACRRLRDALASLNPPTEEKTENQ
jgi:HPt (histidine-containing phosphotransfer) domain-containing protein